MQSQESGSGCTLIENAQSSRAQTMFFYPDLTVHFHLHLEIVVMILEAVGETVRVVGGTVTGTTPRRAASGTQTDSRRNRNRFQSKCHQNRMTGVLSILTDPYLRQTNHRLLL